MRRIRIFFLAISCSRAIINIYGDIAQLGERCVRNAKVAGSNPVVSTIKKARYIRENVENPLYTVLF